MSAVPLGPATAQRAPATAPAAVAPALLPGEGHLLRGFPAKDLVAVRAQGSTVWDASGRAFQDFGGASHGVAILGHNHPRVVAAVQEQARELLHVAQGIQSPARAAFLEALHAQLPRGLTTTFIANSGAEAMECAAKMAAVATGRSRFVAARDSFHGRTAAALGLTHRPGFRDPFQAILPACDFAPYDDIEALKATVTRETAAVVLEPVQGEGGVRVASPSYLRAARDIAHDAGALLVLDEIQSGLGRTGHFLAATSAGVVADITTMAKGLAGGLPIGTCSMTDEVAGKLPPGGHGSTYGGSPLVCAAGLAALQVLAEERLVERATTVGDRFRAQLAQVAHPAIKGVAGAGLMVGLDLRIRPQNALKALQGAGFLCLAGGNTGLRFLPPLNVDESDLQRLVEALPACLS